MSEDHPLGDEPPVDTFYLTAITEKVETTRKLRKLFETIPESERGDVFPPFVRPNFSEALNDFGGLLVSLADGTPIACLMAYPYQVPLPDDSFDRSGNWYELGSIYVEPRFRQFQLAEFLVAFAVMRLFMMNSEVWLRRIFAVSFPYQHPDQRAIDPTIPESRGGMAHILSARHRGFEPSTPSQGLLDVREAKGMLNDLKKLWWMAGDFALEQAASFLDGAYYARKPETYLLGTREQALLDCSAVGNRPAGGFAQAIKDPMAAPDDREGPSRPGKLG